MVRNKNFEALSQYGVKALVVVLGTYIKQVISGNVADLIPWKYVFGAKKYKKEPAKGFLSYVFKVATTIIVLLASAIISLPLESNSIRLSWW